MYATLWTQYTCTSISLNISCCPPIDFSAPSAESLPGKLFDVFVHQVRPHVDKQDPLSGELCRGEHPCVTYYGICPEALCYRHCSGPPSADVF